MVMPVVPIVAWLVRLLPAAKSLRLVILTVPFLVTYRLPPSESLTTSSSVAIDGPPVVNAPTLATGDDGGETCVPGNDVKPMMRFIRAAVVSVKIFRLRR